MSYQELISSNIKMDLIYDIENMDLTGCTNQELVFLRSWVNRAKELADLRTLEDEVVGYTYSNLAVLNPKISNEEVKRGIRLVKTM